MKINPGLRVTIGGNVLPTARTQVGQVLVDELVVDWGGDEALSQPDPATASVAILDFELGWAARSDLIGLLVLIEWTPDAVLTGQGVTTSRVIFRGRVDGVELDEPSWFTIDGRDRLAATLTLTASSVEVDLANRFVTDGSSWPAETIRSRADRIAALGGIPVHVRAYWGDQPAAAVPADELAGRSARDLLLQLYNSCGGDRLVYSPHVQTYEWMGRRLIDARTLAGVTRSTDPASNARGNLGYYVQPWFTRSSTGVTTTDHRSVWLDGRWMTPAGGMRKAAGQRITRAQVTWRPAATPDTERTAVVVDPLANEASIGSRAITLDSLHAGDLALLNAQDLLAMATQEGSTWRPPAFRWDTRDTDGFQTVDQLTVSLRGHAVAYPIWIGRTWFPLIGIRPLFSVIGGRIAYADGRWIVDYRLAGWTAAGGGNASPVRTKQHAVTWAELDPSQTMVWTDAPAPAGLHASVTYEDLRFVGRGAGATSEGPDTGWDEYQQ